jgi:ferritin-like metal-binding protein YciE
MPSTTVSNPRDLILQLLGELLYVERRLADDVLRTLASAVRDDGLREALEEHLAETRKHAEHVETAFRRLSVAPTSNLSRPFESAVAQHEQLSSSMVEPRLADLFHAQAALHTEHWEIAAYEAVLPLLDDGVSDLLRRSLHEEEDAAKNLVAAIARLSA